MQHLGRLLAASPSQKDPFWAKSVVWLYEYNQGSYAGLIINKPSDKTCEDLARHHGIAWSCNRSLHVGGPVNPSALILQHTTDWRTPNTQYIQHSDLSLSSHKSMLTRLSQGDEPEQWRLILGYCSWAPGQLERELMSSQGWLVLDYNPTRIWDHRRPETIWHQCLDEAAQQTVDKLFEIQ
jgi:putative transcriptional regulator